MTIYDMTPSQRVYYRRKVAGLCVHCGKSIPWRGTTMCGPCWRAKRASEDRTDPDRIKRRERRRELWHKRREQGLCVDCGKHALQGQARCDYHQTLLREKAHVKLIQGRLRA